MTHLKLNEFKEAYRSISRGLPVWAKHLVLGFLVWLETKYIDAKAKAEVNRALDDVLEDFPSQIEVPYTVWEDELRITADFYKPTDERTTTDPSGEAPEGP